MGFQHRAKFPIMDLMCPTQKLAFSLVGTIQIVLFITGFGETLGDSDPHNESTVDSRIGKDNWLNIVYVVMSIIVLMLLCIFVHVCYRCFCKKKGKADAHSPALEFSDSDQGDQQHDGEKDDNKLVSFKDKDVTKSKPVAARESAVDISPQVGLTAPSSLDDEEPQPQPYQDSAWFEDLYHHPKKPLKAPTQGSSTDLLFRSSVTSSAVHEGPRGSKDGPMSHLAPEVKRRDTKSDNDGGSVDSSVGRESIQSKKPNSKSVGIEENKRSKSSSREEGSKRPKSPSREEGSIRPKSSFREEGSKRPKSPSREEGNKPAISFTKSTTDNVGSGPSTRSDMKTVSTRSEWKPTNTRSDLKPTTNTSFKSNTNKASGSRQNDGSRPSPVSNSTRRKSNLSALEDFLQGKKAKKTSPKSRSGK